MPGVIGGYYHRIAYVIELISRDVNNQVSVLKPGVRLKSISAPNRHLPTDIYQRPNAGELKMFCKKQGSVSTRAAWEIGHRYRQAMAVTSLYCASKALRLSHDPECHISIHHAEYKARRQEGQRVFRVYTPYICFRGILIAPTLECPGS
jgi:hypothetical protein